MAKGKIIEASGSASAVTRGSYTAKELEEVMSNAISEVVAAGEQDPDKIRAAMLYAKDEFIKSRLAEQNGAE